MLADPDRLLGDGLLAIRNQFNVPGDFPPEALAEAERTKNRSASEHVDWSERDFVSLDPAVSTDLDQAFVIFPWCFELMLHFALADLFLLFFLC